MFLIDWALHSKEELSEQLLLDTHKILCEYIPSQNGNLEYAGTYRTVAAMAGSTLFTAAENVPCEMRIFIDDFNNDVKSREILKEMDPFFLAADICQDFVTIHTFLDGNGRMCRLIANAYLLRYAGVVISIGEDEMDRHEYLDIAAYAGDGETEENARGMLARFFLKKGTRALGELKEFLVEMRFKKRQKFF